MPAGAITPDWAGEAVFIVAGGPSVAQHDLDLLRGRKIVALNSSFERLARFDGPPPHLPHIDVLLFGDNRWWQDKKGNSVYRDKALLLDCEIVSLAQSVHHERVTRLRKHHPPGLSRDRGALTFKRTILSAAINYAALRAPQGPIILLGADGKFGPNKQRNHFAPYTFQHRPGTWERHYSELATLVQPLKEMGIAVWNASPGSAWNLWPIMTLEEAIARSMDGQPSSLPAGQVREVSRSIGCAAAAA